MSHDVDNGDTTSLVGCAVELSGLLDYQQDAVVSRTLVGKDVGTVTLFAFAKGQGLSEHTAPFDALVYVLEGEAQVTISDEAFSVGWGRC